MSTDTCLFCKKTFSRKSNCNTHLLTCKVKKDHEHKELCNELDKYKTENNELKNQCNELLLELISVKKELDLYKNIIENKNKNSFKEINQGNNNQVNNNNTQINIFNATPPSLKDLINNLEPIDFNQIKNSFENDLSNKYIDKGIEGIARFICDIPCQNKIFTTDYSRKVIAYKTQEQIIVDPKGSILFNTALKQNADTIIDKTEDRYNYWKLQVKEAHDDDIEPHEIDIENKKHTKKLLNIATKAKQNVSVSPIEATNIFVMKGIENKNYTAIE
jgi:hypothetical protein